MGFLQSSINFTAFEVAAPPGPDMRQAVLDGLERGRIGRIDIDLGHDKASGFAAFDDPLDTDFKEENVFIDPLVLFAFRIDRLSVPGSTLRLYVRKRMADMLAATRRERLRREEADELRDAVRLDLLRKALPAINAYDVVWDTRSGRVRIFTTTRAILDDFVTMMREAVGIELKEMNTVGVLERGLDEQALHDAYHLLPATFGGGGGVEEEVDS